MQKKMLAMILVVLSCMVTVTAYSLPYYRTIPEVRAMSHELEGADIRLVGFLSKSDHVSRDYLLFEQREFSQFPGLTRHQLGMVMLALPQESDLGECENKWVVVSGKYRTKTRSSGALGFRDEIVPEIIATLEEDRVICPLGKAYDLESGETDGID